MKWKALALTFLIGCAGAFAGELEDILEKHYEALGGKDALAKVESMKATGKYTMSMGGNNMEFPFVMTMVDADDKIKVRIDSNFQGQSMVQAYDGEKGWRIMPMMGPDPQDMSEEEAKAFSDQMAMFGDLYGWEEKGHKLEYKGVEDVEGTETHVIQVTTADDRERTVFLDSEYYLPIKSKMTTNMMGQEIEVEAFSSDYKKVGDLMVAHATVTSMGPGGQMEIKLEEVLLNPEVEDKIFQKPPKKETAEEQPKKQD